ncbi:DUF7793 family protein [Bizionia myxarmorum]|uniref:DUF7793 domain-containing protein n=1 Tax=Bizionia myxarmorum TaxID=291186 RepID=A0A5D0RDR2_9FLAO|nr:hypothetical protein [Bizionia myxarmorum]TYB79071.1 hypothetical protein ES674_04650 [Bizionia myxarmorum]
MNALTLHQLESVKFWIENDILFCNFNQNDYHWSEDDAKSQVSKIEELTKGKRMPFVIDARGFTGNFEPNAAKIFAGSSMLSILSFRVFIADTLHGKLLISSYSRIYAPDIHIEVCTTKAEALAYCAKSLKIYNANNN